MTRPAPHAAPGGIAPRRDDRRLHAVTRPAPTTSDVVDLLWFDRASLPRVRKRAAFRALLDALEREAPDPDVDDLTLGASRAEVEDRRDVFEVLARGDAIDAAGLDDALTRAIRPDGKLVPPLVLAAGELALPFDDVETLKAHVAVITPLAAGDERLRAELALLRDFFATPDLGGAVPIVDALAARLWDAFGRSKRAVPADVLRAHADATLLLGRKLQRREVFGGAHLRALLTAGGAPIPAYLPASLAATLPMYQRFRARILCEVHLSVDQQEASVTALRVLALARLVDRSRRRDEIRGA